jgi:hypothetical protein
VTNAVAIVAIVVLAAVLVVVCAALVEVFRQLNALRAITQLDDRPIPLTLSKEALVNGRELSLPSEVADAPTAAVVVLSHDCATCVAIAEDLGAHPAPTLWFTMVGHDGESRVSRALAAQREHLIPGLGELLRERLGLDVAPAVVVLEFGKLRHAYAVGSTRQVNALVPTVFELGSAREPAVAAGMRDG